MKRLLILWLAILAAPAPAQLVTATLPTTCNAAQTQCIRSTPVTNPDGTSIGGGGGSSGATATAAAPTRVEGSTGQPQSQDLSGNTRTLSTINGTLPAFATTPTFNLGTLNGAATAANQTTMNTTLGLPFQAGGSIGNTSFAATQATASNLNAQIVGAGASGATAVGNPAAVAGIYKTTALTLTDGQRGDLLLGTRQALKVQMTLPDNVNNAGFQGASSDGFSSTSVNAYNSFAFPSVYNGTVSGWDRSRSITGALADGTGLGVLAVEQAGRLFSNITTATTTTVKSGKGIFSKLVLNTYVASATITIYDSTTASGTKIATITLPSTITSDTPAALPYDLQFSTGLTIVTSGATDITVVYR